MIKKNHSSIQTIIDQTNCTKQLAIQTLKECNYDIVESILKIVNICEYKTNKDYFDSVHSSEYNSQPILFLNVPQIKKRQIDKRFKLLFT